MLDFDIKEYCYGCNACATVCPQNAITMRADNDGFLIPEIDKNKCIECGSCDRICIYQNVPSAGENGTLMSAECRMVRMASEDIMHSASGGLFYGIAKAALKQGYKVCGCIWNDELEAVHILTDDITKIKKMQGSKYVQSRVDKCYREIKKELDAGEKVLFSGTPCQVAGLIKTIGNSQNLLTIGLVCEGVPSPMVLARWLQYMKQKAGSPVETLIMRKKGRYGWKSPTIEYRFKNGKKLERLAFHLDPYMHNFICGLFMRNSCFNCQYKGDLISADIIAGDCWCADYGQIQASNNKGLSAVILRSSKGKAFYKNIKNIFIDEPLDLNVVIEKNEPLLKPIKRNPNRDRFYGYISDHTLLEGIKKYGHYWTKKMVIYWVLYHLHLFGPIKKLVKK